MGVAQGAPEVLDYHERADEDLVSAAKAGDNLAMEFLLNKYKNFVRIKAKSYFLIGADREDIIQEGMIGLYKAVRDFKADELPRLCRTVHHAADHHRDQDRDASEAHSAEPVHLAE